MAEEFGNQALLTEYNIPKYFNKHTLPFIARHNNNIIGYIIGVPIENFKEESWAQYDYNMGKNNTLYTHSFVFKKSYRKKGAYAKTLKRIYLNWAKKRGYLYITGHVSEGISKKFSNYTEIVSRTKPLLPTTTLVSGPATGSPRSSRESVGGVWTTT